MKGIATVVFASMSLASFAWIDEGWITDRYYHVTNLGDMTKCNNNPQSIAVIGSSFRSSGDKRVLGMDMAWLHECAAERLCAPSNVTAGTYGMAYDKTTYIAPLTNALHLTYRAIDGGDWMKYSYLETLDDQVLSGYSDSKKLSDYESDAFYSRDDFQTEASVASDLLNRGYFYGTWISQRFKNLQKPLNYFVIPNVEINCAYTSDFTCERVVNSNGNTIAFSPYENVLYWHHTVAQSHPVQSYTSVWDARAELKWMLENAPSKEPGEDRSGYAMGCRSVYCGSGYTTYAIIKIEHQAVDWSKVSSYEMPTTTVETKYVLINTELEADNNWFCLYWLYDLVDDVLDIADIDDSDAAFPPLTQEQWQWLRGGGCSLLSYVKVKLVKLFPVHGLRTHASLQTF